MSEQSANNSAADVSSNRLVNFQAVAWFGNAIAYSITYPFIPIYLHQNRGFPMSKVGLIFPIVGAAMMVFPPLAGYLVDRFGRRRVLVCGPLLRACCFIVLAALAYFNASFWSICLALFFAAGAGTFFPNASETYITEITRPEERPHSFGKTRVGMNVGWAMGPMLGAFLARTPFSHLFALTALLCILAAAFVWKFCPEPQRIQPASDRNTDAQTLSLLKVIAGDRRFLYFNLAALFLFMLVSQLYSTLSIYATDSVGISKDALGFLYAINGSLVIFLQIPINKLTSGIRLEPRIILGIILYITGYFAFGFCAQWAHLAVAVGVLTLGELCVIPALTSLISHLARPEMLGRYMGVFGLVRGMGYSIGPYIGSLLYEKYPANPVILWGVLAGFAFAALGIFAAITVADARQARATA